MVQEAHAGLNVEDLRLHSYSIHVDAIFSSGAIIPLTSSLQRLRISNKYSEFVMPEYRMIFNLLPEMILAIQNDLSKIVFEITIEYTDRETTLLNQKDTPATQQVIPSMYMNKMMIKPLLSDKGMLTIPDETSVQPGEEASTRLPMKFELVGVPEEVLAANKAVDSGVLHNVTVTEAILLLAGKNKIKIHLHKPDNETRYPQIILYPGNFFMNLYHINNTYGIYKDELKVYMNQKGLVITPMDSKRTIDKGNVNIHVNFPIDRNVEKMYEGDYMVTNVDGDAIDKVIMVNTNRVALTDHSSLAGELFGTTHHVMSKSIYKVEEDIRHQTNFDRFGAIQKPRMVDNILSNPYTINSFMKNQTVPRLLTINYDNLNIHPDDGFKGFTVRMGSTNYVKYEGPYKCLSITNDFRKGEKNFYNLSGVIKIKASDDKMYTTY